MIIHLVVCDCKKFLEKFVISEKSENVFMVLRNYQMYIDVLLVLLLAGRLWFIETEISTSCNLKHLDLYRLKSSFDGYFKLN